jgi:hypothetical protein
MPMLRVIQNGKVYDQEESIHETVIGGKLLQPFDHVNNHSGLLDHLPFFALIFVYSYVGGHLTLNKFPKSLVWVTPR